jgi:DNA-binding NarL/FixJ family response regulator
MERVRTLIVADLAPVRAGLSALLRRDDAMQVVGESSARREAVAFALGAGRVDVVLLDSANSGPEALTLTLEALAGVGPHPALVVIGEQPAREFPALAGSDWLPGWGYFLRDKGDGAMQLAAALRAAALGTIVLDRHLRLGASLVPVPALAEDLTPREREVLALLALGLPNKQIATKLGVTPHTAKFHVAQILHKLGAESRTEAVAQAARRGLVAL